MTRLIIKYVIILFYLIWTPLAGQDFDNVDRIVATWPASFSSPDKLAALISQNFTRPDEEARAAFTWIANHITYNIRALNKPQKIVSFSYSSREEKQIKENQLQQELAIRTLRKHKAVCHGYAALYKVVCGILDIDCVIISGTAKIHESDIGRLPGTPNHSWNAVHLNGQWKFVDVTWGAGYINGSPPKFHQDYDNVYFFTPPDKFYLNHYPFDKKWLFIKMTPEEFARLPLYYPEALRSGIRIISPPEGVVKLSGKKRWSLVLENYQGGIINFALNGRNYPNSLMPKTKGSRTIFVLPVHRPGQLTVFLNGKAFAGFKLVR